MENNDLKFEIESVSYNIILGKENLRKLLNKDLENEDNDKQNLFQILSEKKGVSNVDYNAMFSLNAISLTIEEELNTNEYREDLLKIITSYINN